MATLRDVILAMPGYVDAGNPTDAAVDAYLAELVTQEVELSFTDLIVWGSQNQTMRQIRQAIVEKEANFSGGVANDVYNDLLAAWSLLNGGGDTPIDLKRADVRSIWENIAGPSKPITAPAKNALFALSDQQVPRWHTAEGYAGAEDWDTASRIAHIQRARA